MHYFYNIIMTLVTPERTLKPSLLTLYSSASIQVKVMARSSPAPSLTMLLIFPVASQ